MSIQTINPTTGEVLETFEAYKQEQINEALEQAHQAFLRWRMASFSERAKHLHSVASHLRDHKHELARTAVLEMGKSITEAEGEVEKCAWNCDYFAGNAERFLADEKVATNATESYVAFRPLGVILAIMRWNWAAQMLLLCWQMRTWIRPRRSLLRPASRTMGRAASRQSASSSSSRLL